MSETAVSVEGVSVRYRPYVDRRPTLRKSVVRFRHRNTTDVIALDDVSFTVDKGEAFGVIGRNGSGKSTLVRCMAGTLRPNEGRVRVFGRSSTLLSLGTGFNPELSGGRNIYLGSLAAGMRKREIDDIFDEIVEYAELGDAIDRPIKTYSSGMYARLAFSVGIHQNPDVLFLDEVLAVGDEAFKEKSMQSMDDLLARAGTIVFVSHSLGRVQDFCDRALWLSEGKIQEIGESGEIVQGYREFIAESAASR